MSLKIYAFPASPRAFKVLSFANHIGIPYEFVLCDLTNGAQRSPEFTALNINQRMPVLEEDGWSLWESNAILQYLADEEARTRLCFRSNGVPRRCEQVDVLGKRALGSGMRHPDFRALRESASSAAVRRIRSKSRRGLPISIAWPRRSTSI